MVLEENRVQEKYIIESLRKRVLIICVNKVHENVKGTLYWILKVMLIMKIKFLVDYFV